MPSRISGYRTGFDVKDLLTTEDGAAAPPEQSGLFPAHEVLTTAPLTILDYRRLLLRSRACGTRGSTR